MYNFIMLFIFQKLVQEQHLFCGSGFHFFWSGCGSWFSSSGSGFNEPKIPGSSALVLGIKFFKFL